MPGGQNQCPPIVRALATVPQAVLAGGPTGYLDADNGAEVFRLFRELGAETGVSIVRFTDDDRLAAQVDRILTLEGGRLASEPSPRKAMLGTLNSEEIEQTLHEATYGRLGLHTDGRTYIVPVGYAYDGKRLLCHSAEGLKVEMMRKNPEVCFEVEVIERLGQWRSVILWGRAVELKGVEAATALGLLIDRLMPLLDEDGAVERGVRSVTPPSRDPSTHGSVVYAIEIAEKTGRFERSGP